MRSKEQCPNFLYSTLMEQVLVYVLSLLQLLFHLLMQYPKKNTQVCAVFRLPLQKLKKSMGVCSSHCSYDTFKGEGYVQCSFALTVTIS